MGILTPGGTHLKMGYGHVSSFKIPISRPTVHPLRLPFQNFLVPQDPYFHMKSQIFRKFAFQILKIGESSSS